MRLRLPRRRIVRQRAIFDAAFARGRRVADRCLTLIVLGDAPEKPFPDTGEAAFLTPKRLGDASLRNRLRRRLREAYRRHRPELLPAAGTRLIWLAKSPATALDFAELVTHMKDLHTRSLRDR